jgi:RNA polymerase sigma-70 factor (ECF subfamily)
MDDETYIHERLVENDFDAAVEAILELYGSRFFRTIAGVLRNEAEAADTYQDFSIALWQGLPGFRGDSRVYTWAYTLVRRTIGRKLRGKPVQIVRLKTDQERALVARWTRTATVEWRNTESREKLQEMLDDLGYDDRTLVMLRICEQMPWGEIATVLSDTPLEPQEQKTESARLRKRFERVKTRLQKALEDE